MREEAARARGSRACSLDEYICESSSVVERLLAKEKVAGSSPVSRSNIMGR